MNAPRLRVLGAAMLDPPAGWTAQVYDCDAVPCACKPELYLGIPALPVAVEKRGSGRGVRRAERHTAARMCLICGTTWNPTREDLG